MNVPIYSPSWHLWILGFCYFSGSDSAILYGSCKFTYALVFCTGSFIWAPGLLLSMSMWYRSPKRLEMRQEHACKRVIACMASTDWEQGSWQLLPSNCTPAAWCLRLPPKQKAFLNRAGGKQGMKGNVTGIWEGFLLSVQQRRSSVLC